MVVIFQPLTLFGCTAIAKEIDLRLVFQRGAFLIGIGCVERKQQGCQLDRFFFMFTPCSVCHDIVHIVVLIFEV